MYIIYDNLKLDLAVINIKMSLESSRQTCKFRIYTNHRKQNPSTVQAASSDGKVVSKNVMELVSLVEWNLI